MLTELTSDSSHVGTDSKRLGGGAGCIRCTHQQLEVLQGISILPEETHTEGLLSCHMNTHAQAFLNYFCLLFPFLYVFTS